MNRNVQTNPYTSRMESNKRCRRCRFRSVSPWKTDMTAERRATKEEKERRREEEKFCLFFTFLLFSTRRFPVSFSFCVCVCVGGGYWPVAAWRGGCRYFKPTLNLTQSSDSINCQERWVGESCPTRSRKGAGDTSMRLRRF